MVAAAASTGVHDASPRSLAGRLLHAARPLLVLAVVRITSPPLNESCRRRRVDRGQMTGLIVAFAAGNVELQAAETPTQQKHTTHKNRNRDHGHANVAQTLVMAVQPRIDL